MIFLFIKLYYGSYDLNYNQYYSNTAYQSNLQIINYQHFNLNDNQQYNFNNLQQLGFDTHQQYGYDTNQQFNFNDNRHYYFNNDQQPNFDNQQYVLNTNQPHGFDTNREYFYNYQQDNSNNYQQYGLDNDQKYIYDTNQEFLNDNQENFDHCVQTQNSNLDFDHHMSFGEFQIAKNTLSTKSASNSNFSVPSYNTDGIKTGLVSSDQYTLTLLENTTPISTDKNQTFFDNIDIQNKNACKFSQTQPALIEKIRNVGSGENLNDKMFSRQKPLHLNNLSDIEESFFDRNKFINGRIEKIKKTFDKSVFKSNKKNEKKIGIIEDVILNNINITKDLCVKNNKILNHTRRKSKARKIFLDLYLKKKQILSTLKSHILFHNDAQSTKIQKKINRYVLEDFLKINKKNDFNLDTKNINLKEKINCPMICFGDKLEIDYFSKNLCVRCANEFNHKCDFFDLKMIFDIEKNQ
ncbi:hypothetical protein GVAV_003144 [Gurleya vavrai]